MLSNSKSIKIIILSLVVIGAAATLLLTVNIEEDPPETSQSNTETVQAAPYEINVFKESFTQAEYESGLENSKNAKSMPNAPIDKVVPSGHVFGFTADNGLGGGMNAIPMFSTDEKFSMRFTAKFSGDLVKLHLSPLGANSTKVRVGLQEDIKGLPSGQWLGDSPGYVETILKLKPNTNETIELLENTFLKENEVYHIVIELVDEVPLGFFYMVTFHANSPFTPFNHIDPDNTWPDEAINTLFFDGTSWLVQDRWPIYVIEYSDGISDGQPYTLMAPWVIRGSNGVGQTVKPFSNYDVNEIAFVVSYDGNPTDNLYYTVYDEKNNSLRDGLFAIAEEITTTKSWHTIQLDSPLTIKSGELYRFVLSSPNTDLENAYKVYGHEFMVDPSLGYGSVNHHLTKSLDRVHWNKWYDADTAFKLITK